MSRLIRHIMAVVVLTIIMGCTPLPQAGTPTASTTAFHVIPVEAPPGDLDDLLGVDRWKFQLALPQPPPDPRAAPQDDALIRLTYRLEVRQAGQVARVLVGSTVGHPSPSEDLEVIMFPIDFPEGQPQRLKVLIHGMAYVIDDPAKSSHMRVYTQPAKPLPDGSFLLMEMGEDTIPSPDNTQLVFSVTQGAQP